MDRIELIEKKEAIRNRYKGVPKEQIEFIPAKNQYIKNETASVKRVAIYARVSTDTLEQTSSIELQQNHYRDYVKEHPDWELVDIYVDEGISGTSIKGRKNFNRMLDDCRAGLIDLILTKSISRFARNIVDCISVVRELKALPSPIGVIFESEHLFTLDDKTEMVLSMLSAIAQEESHIRSDLMNMSIEQRFSRGIFMINKMLGYNKDAQGNMSINEDEAEIIKVIFYMFVNGYKQAEIRNILNKYQCSTKYGRTKWNVGDVSYILRNEKYCGDVLCHKTYTPNYLDHKPAQNKKNRNQYLHQDHHPAIIARRIFNTANSLRTSYKHTFKYARKVPQLYVINEGTLKGFVTVYKTWPFSYDEYREASLEAFGGNFSNPVKKDIITPTKYDGFEVVCEEFFFKKTKPLTNISFEYMFFNAFCAAHEKIKDTYEILFSPLTKRLTVRACNADCPNAISGLKGGKQKYPFLYGKAFCNMLYEVMGWNPDNCYKIYGRLITSAGGSAIIFDLKDALKSEKTTTGVGVDIDFEEEFKERFGFPYKEFLLREHENLGEYIPGNKILASNSSVLSPKELKELRDECNLILEKWEKRLNLEEVNEHG